mgnify:CR=1 FL=1|tara:strand:- start:271 stop:1224 length:954 start_codon:yes stop_codon:yes gene_type:complete
MAITKVSTNVVNDQVIGRKNIIINGDMKVYQRNQSRTGFTTAYKYYTADRMRFSSEGGTVGTWNQEVQTDQNIGDYSNVNVLKTTCTSAGQDFKRGVNYRIEPIDIKHMIGKTCTLSFYAKADATVTQQRALAFISSGSAASSVDLGDITLTTSYTKYTATFTMANCTDYVDMLLRVDGDTETSSYITLIQLELGSQATPFEFKKYDEELSLCERYYQVLQNPCPRGVIASTGNPVAANRLATPLKTEMRSAPTVALSGTFNVYDGLGTGTISNVTATYSSTSAIEFDSLAGFSSTAGRACCVYNSGSYKATAEAEL